MTPSDVDRSAPILVEHSRLIDTPPHVVWSLLVNVDWWPRWNPDMLTASLDGRFAPGSSLAWSAKYPGGLAAVTIYAIEHERSVLWGSVENGFKRIQRWEIERRFGGVVVTTQESWDGAPFVPDPSKTPGWQYPDPIGARLNLETWLSRWVNFIASATLNKHRGGE